MLQPPEIGAESTDQGGHEDKAQKQGVLWPEAEPSAFQELLVLEVISCAEEGGYDGQHKESQPDGALP